MSERPGAARPLFVQALGLVIVTLVAAQLIAIAVIFTLPAPPPEFYRMSEIGRALKSGTTVQPRDGRPLVLRHNAGPIRGLVDNRRRAEFKNALAREIGVDPALIEMDIDTGPRFFVRAQKPVTFVQQLPPRDDRHHPPEGAGGPGGLGRPDGPGGPPGGPPGAPPGPPRIFRFDGPREEPFIVGDFKVAVHQNAGRWTVVEPKPLSASTAGSNGSC
jgi:two-component system OmpR family sensor kinase